MKSGESNRGSSRGETDDVELLRKLAGIKDSKEMKAETQLNRLLGKVWRNPYDVLQIDMNANDDEIRKQFKMFTIILHPDKCDDPRAKDAFPIIDSSYKTLQDPTKKRMFQKIMSDAKERTDYEREQENKKRKKQDLPPLPLDTYHDQYMLNCKKIFDEIEDAREHQARQDRGAQLRRQEKVDLLVAKKEYEIFTQDQWEKSQPERIDKWKKFQNKAGRIGGRGTTGEIRHPSMRPEERESEFTKDATLSAKASTIDPDDIVLSRR